jgi:hypothetical protein
VSDERPQATDLARYEKSAEEFRTHLVKATAGEMSIPVAAAIAVLFAQMDARIAELEKLLLEKGKLICRMAA